MTIVAAGYVPEHGWRAVRRYVCEECSSITDEPDLLRAPNPFDASDELIGCPHCRQVNGFALVCDFPGCQRESSSGEPTPEGGYVHRCHEHSLWAFRNPPETNPMAADRG